MSNNTSRQNLRARFVVALLAVCAIAFLSACVPATPEKRAAQVATSIGETVKAGMNAAGVMYRAGQINDAQWDQIAAVYAKVQKSEKVVADFLAAYKGVGDPMALVNALQTTANDLAALIQSFKKPQAFVSPKLLFPALYEEALCL